MHKNFGRNLQSHSSRFNASIASLQEKRRQESGDIFAMHADNGAASGRPMMDMASAIEESIEMAFGKNTEEN